MLRFTNLATFLETVCSSQFIYLPHTTHPVTTTFTELTVTDATA